MKGANRTGRPFTGDYAGDLLYATLKKFGFAKGKYDARPDDDFELVDCRITNAVRCVPPENKPTPAEITACRPFLVAEIAAMKRLKAMLALGAIAHQTVLATLGLRQAQLSVQARRAASVAERIAARRFLPLLALQHEHRPPHHRDVRGRIREALYCNRNDVIETVLVTASLKNESASSSRRTAIA